MWDASEFSMMLNFAVATIEGLSGFIIAVTAMLKLQSRMDSFENGSKMFDKCIWKLNMKMNYTVSSAMQEKIAEVMQDVHWRRGIPPPT